MKCGLEAQQRRKRMSNNHVLIIAEAGVNHNGDLDKALTLISAAAEAGADYVKFQTFKAEKLVHKSAKKADYQIANTENNDSQFNMLKQLEIPSEWYPQLIEHAKNLNIKFLSTGFDEESIDFLDQIGCDLFKIPSGEITNKPFIEHIASKGKPIIYSSGMASMNDVEATLNLLLSCGVKKDAITALHCNTQYPTPMEDVNLKAMLTMREHLGVNIGYSDHTLGIEVPIAATALGARVIEKHFTLDRNLPGPDHKASLIPSELKDMVTAIRNIELAISGDGRKEPSNSEKPNVTIARKSIHLKNKVKAGSSIQREDLIMLRPGDGISPMDIDEVVGKQVKNDLDEYTKLSWEDIR